jgi:hypothetical protein
MTASNTYLVIADDGTQYGPITEPDLRAWIQERRVGAHNQAWQEGAPEWKPLSEHAAFRGSFAPPPPPPPLRVRVVNQAAQTRTAFNSAGQALPRGPAKESKSPTAMRYVWQVTVAIVVGVGILLTRGYWTSTASLEKQVRKNIEETFRKNADTAATQIMSFHLVHEGGSRYKGLLEAMTGAKTETVEVDVTYDGRTFEWKIIPAAHSPAPVAADPQPDLPPATASGKPARQSEPAAQSLPSQFNTVEKSLAENQNVIVAVRRIQSGVHSVVEKTSIEEVTKNPYAALGKVCRFTGEAYKVEACAPNPVMKGPWTDILVLVPNDNSPTGGTTVDFMCQGDLSAINSGDQVTLSGYFIGTYESKNAVGGTVEGVGIVGDSLTRSTPLR